MSRNYIESLLSSHFPDFSALPRTTKKEAVLTVLLYMFGSINSSKLSSRLKVVKGNKKQFRLSLNSNLYTFKVKAYLYYAYAHGLSSPYAATTIKAGKKFHLEPNDIKLIAYTSEYKLKALLNKYVNKRKYKVHTVKSFKQSVRVACDMVRIFTNRFVARKHRFILKSLGLDVYDFSTDLICKGIQALMTTYPCIESQLHAENIMKRSIHNAGINLIKTHTANTRSAVIKNKDGTFSSLKMSFNLLNNDQTGSTNTEFLTCNMAGASILSYSGNCHNSTDDVITVNQLIGKYRGKKQELLELMTGTLCKDFTQYLRDEEIIGKDTDNEDYYLRLADRENGYTKYMRHASSYLDLDFTKAVNLMAEVKQELGGALH